MTKIIGITGGIGSGKSTVSAYIMNLGFTIIDLDKIARDVLNGDGRDALIKELSETFGDNIFENGVLNRNKLAGLAFTNSKEKEKLDAVMLPPIVEKTLFLIDQYKQEGKSAIFLDAPLLFEAKMQIFCTETWLVYTEENLRINRVISRENTTSEKVKKRMALQMPEEEKAKLADFIIYNNQDTPFLENQIQNKLKEMNLV